MQETQYWQAVLDRDRQADGQFVYAVRSTGIYCRPSCPSRRPGPDQVAFYPAPAVAEAAGFRACRRCGPEGADHSDGANAVAEICRLLDAEGDMPLTLAVLGQAVGLSPSHLQRVFKRAMGVTPRAYAAARRAERFKAGVRAGDSVGAAGYAAGYGSSSRLYEAAPAALGMTPAEYRRGGVGRQIRYTTAACPLGRLLVAATERGLCMVSLGDSDAPLEAALRADYPAAAITRTEAGSDLDNAVTAILRHLRGEQPALDLPLDVQATAFQRRVWEALRAIPYGQTRTYGAIAAALGTPTASRAVGRACATNMVSLVVPCHRAVGSNGSLTGYRWGVDRKAALLAAEAAGAPVAPHMEDK
ncbi:MAG: bifunctional DNA-binding transcriptional regulator/O6-methylguanine-DNA methyltransferase Ada [Chloroflexota bacterium]|nr:bifunctional DNA-binding transcriptional regulator/O6-methylguanine-DNA methyltransferase Ada [Chloroflexota bacterium]